MGVKLVSSSGGSVELVAPTTASDFTKTVPATSGALLDENSNIEAQVKTATNASGSAPIYSCRAWVNFNGTGTVAIRASGNVSSITDNGVGDYIVNFTTAFADVNYSIVATGNIATNNSGRSIAAPGSSTNTSSAVGVRCFRTDTLAAEDFANINVAIFR